MPLTVLEDALLPVWDKAGDKDFSEILRDAREAIGLKLFRAAEFMGIYPTRLRNLESGYFRVKPSSAEILAMAKLYDVHVNFLDRKADEFIKARKRKNRVQVDE